MAGSFSDFTESNCLAKIFGKTDWTPGVTYYIALMTARGTVAQADANTNWVEATGGSYARVAVTNNVTNFPAPTGTAPTQTTLHILTTYVTPTADWGTIVAYAIYDAVTGGNEISWADLVANQTVNNGNTVQWAADALVTTLD